MTHAGDSAEATAAQCSVRERCTCKLPIVAGIVLAGILLDQVTKEIAIALLKPENVVKIYFNDIFRFQFATNTGAFLSLGSTLPDGVRLWVLTGLNGVILAGVACYLFWKRSLPRVPSIALALILAGGLGNIIDRLFRGGEVVDFMNLGLPGVRLLGYPLRTGIFNVADVAIMLGLGILVCLEIFGRRKKNAEPVPEEQVQE